MLELWAPASEARARIAPLPNVRRMAGFCSMLGLDGTACGKAVSLTTSGASASCQLVGLLIF